MRTHLLHSGLLLPLLLEGCHETATDPRREEPGQSVDLAQMVAPADSSAESRRTAHFHFVANGDFARVFSISGPDASGNFLTIGIGVERFGGGDGQVFLGYTILNAMSYSALTSLPGADTSADPDFVVVFGTGGLINVEFEKVPGVQFRQSGVTEFRVTGVLINTFREGPPAHLLGRSVA